MSNTSDYETQVDAGHAAGVAIGQSLENVLGPFVDAAIDFLAELNERFDRDEAGRTYEYEFAKNPSDLTQLATQGYRLVAVVQGYGSQHPIIIVEREVADVASGANDTTETEGEKEVQ